MTRWHRAPEVLDAARRWKERCLLDDLSVFTDRHLWTSENLDQLDRHFVNNLNMGSGDFLEKLEAQLSPTTPGAKQLAAELMWVLFLFMANTGIRGDSKRRQIKRIWEWSGEPLPPAESALGAVLDLGVGNTGTAYNTGRWRELVFLIHMLRAWKALPEKEKRRLSDDPWGFASWLDALPLAKGRQFRHIVLYLLFPEDFERIASPGDKREIVRAFTDLLEDGPLIDYRDNLSVDKALARVREALPEDISGQERDFYSASLRPRWDSDSKKTKPANAAPPDPDAEWHRKKYGSARVWLVATGEGGRLWPEFKRDSIVAVGFGEVGDLGEFQSREELSVALRGQPGRSAEPMHDSLAAWQFAHVMKEGDYVIAKRGMAEILGEGQVIGGYEFDASRAEYQNVRKVRWDRTGSWPLPDDRRIVSKTLTDFTAEVEWLRWADVLLSTTPLLETEAGASPSPYSIEDALEGLFMPRESLQRTLDALARKKGIILEGAPGVGKTFAARRIAYALMQYRDESRVEMVQFHQSYAYEDFVQGWRPTPEGGFALRNGVFYRFCKRAEGRQSEPHVFIIDEINRGNLSKVFGELMMLVEADKRGPANAIPLTYAQTDKERFFVPENVHIIGMMNTADRSLAMVDYALRRRFNFIRLEPAFGTQSFADHLSAAGVESDLLELIVSRLRALNDRIREDRANLGPGFEIGHSFFVPPETAGQVGLEWYRAVIRDEIEPLLREYWFDQPDTVWEAVDHLLQ